MIEVHTLFLVNLLLFFISGINARIEREISHLNYFISKEKLWGYSITEHVYLNRKNITFNLSEPRRVEDIAMYKSKNCR